jgi:hypothetical protein
MKASGHLHALAAVALWKDHREFCLIQNKISGFEYLKMRCLSSYLDNLKLVVPGLLYLCIVNSVMGLFFTMNTTITFFYSWNSSYHLKTYVSESLTQTAVWVFHSMSQCQYHKTFLRKFVKFEVHLM